MFLMLLILLLLFFKSVLAIIILAMNDKYLFVISSAFNADADVAAADGVVVVIM